MKKSLFLFLLLTTQGAFAMELPADKAERIKTFFNQLSINSMELNKIFYAKDIRFVDPLGEINGVDQIIKYYSGLYKNVKSIRFAFDPIIISGNDAFAPWTMFLKTNGLNAGEEYSVKGGSQFTFDENSNLVTYHRDFFDMGAFVYERVPVLKNIIGYVKKKLKESH